MHKAGNFPRAMCTKLILLQTYAPLRHKINWNPIGFTMRLCLAEEPQFIFGVIFIHGAYSDINVFLKDQNLIDIQQPSAGRTGGALNSY